MICHLLLFMKLFSKKLPYLFYAIKEGGKKENSWPGGQWNAVSKNGNRLHFFLEDMRKIHLYCVLSLNTDLWFITFVIGHTCIHSGKRNEFSVIQRHRAQNLMSNGTRTDDTVKAYNLNNIKNPLSFQADYYYQYNRKFIVVS